MREYTATTMAALKSIFGEVWNADDKYALPTEARYQICEGMLAGNSEFNDLRLLFQTCDMQELCLGVPLAEAMQKCDDHLRLSQPALKAFILTSQQKASTIMACSHKGCGGVRFDSHCCNLQNLSKSASRLFTSGQALLQQLTAGPNALYKRDAPAHLWVFGCAPEALAHWSGPAILRDLPIRQEVAPTDVLGWQWMEEIARGGLPMDVLSRSSTRRSPWRLPAPK